MYCLIVSVGQEFGGVLAGWFWLSFSYKVAATPAMAARDSPKVVHAHGWPIGAGCGWEAPSLSMRAPPTRLLSVLTKWRLTRRCKAGGYNAFLWARCGSDALSPPLHAIGHTDRLWINVRGDDRKVRKQQAKLIGGPSWTLAITEFIRAHFSQIPSHWKVSK